MAKANFVPSKKTIKDDDLDGLVSNQNAHNYKGFFYGDNSEQKFYEGGAHFDYNDLCTRLYNIIQIQSADEKEQLLKTKDLGFPIGNNNQPKQLNMSRNKQIIACSNTLKSINSTKTNMLTKSYLLNNSKFSKIFNGADPNNYLGLSNQKYEHQTFKQGESNYKLTELQKKDEDNYMVKSSINMKTTNDNLELKKTLLNNKTINSGLNFLVNKSDVHFVTK